MTVVGSALLDTSVVVDHLRGDAGVTAKLREIEVLCLPIPKILKTTHKAWAA